MNLRPIAVALLIVGPLLPIAAQINSSSSFQNGAAADGLEIRGSVVEPSYDSGGAGATGIAGVQVALTEFKLIDNAVTPTLFAIISTDSKGEFRFRPERLGEYLIEIKMEGYLPALPTWASIAAGTTTGATTANVTMSRDKPIVETRFGLSRLAGLSGRVLDEDGDPVADLRLRIFGRGLVPIVSDVTTRPDGLFSTSRLQPGSYVVRTMPRSAVPDVIDPFTESDVTVVDRDFESTFWPGVADPASAIPWVAPPGGTLNLPDLHVRKMPTYRAHVFVQSEACTETEQWTLQVVSIEQNDPSTAGFEGSVPVPCGKEFLLRNLHPGSYWFALWSGARDSVNAWALQRAEIKDGNIEVALAMSKGANIDGRVVAAKDAKLPPFSSLSIGIGSAIGNLPSGNRAVIPDEFGRFVFNNVPWLKATILPRLSKDAGYYVQEIRYNGQLIPDWAFSMTPDGTGSVEIVIDDKPASVAVSVMDGDKPYLQAVVAMVKWPMAASSNGLPLGGIWNGTPANPQIQVVGLAPGEYRAFAVRLDDLNKIRPPAMMERLASRGEKVVLERGGSQNITLKLVDPSR